MLSLKNEEGFSFLSDDIAVLGKNGQIYPNLAWPKIYGYNVLDYPSLKSQIMAGRGTIDKLHFRLRARANPSMVRRKIRPESLYLDVNKDGCELSSVYYLFRENIPFLSTDRLDLDKAVEMSIAVMETEYGLFHKFLHWEKFNSLAIDKNPLVDISEIMDNWRLNLRLIFKRVPLSLVRIPISTSHRTYLGEIRDLILRYR